MDLEGTLDRLEISIAEAERQAEAGGETQTYNDLVRRFRDICRLAARSGGKGPRSVTEKNIVLAKFPATAGVPEGQLFAKIKTTGYNGQRVDFSTAEIISTVVYFQDNTAAVHLSTEYLFLGGDPGVLASADQTVRMLETAIADPVLNPQFHQSVAS
ncbi:MAG: hypothetical protein Q7T74_06745 [Candidatus Saccharibacteria bacterium]|nr:hypothetical protein [Candidatus Saccharibacteria bacterium]